MYALVTGASSGIGKAYSTILARDYKHDLLLVSNQPSELQALANELTELYHVKAIALYQDLADQTAAHTIHQWCHENNIEVDILINNAGMFFWQPLVDVPEKKIETILNLHMFTPAMLCRLFGEDMVTRTRMQKNNPTPQRSYILNMSSMTAWMSIPGIQCYNSTKAFVNSFSRSLYYELKPLGITVTTLTPGAIDTPLYGLNDKARHRLVKLGISLTPEHFASIALRRMFKGCKKAMPGWINHLAVPLISHLPDRLIFFAMRRFPQYQSIYK